MYNIGIEYLESGVCSTLSRKQKKNKIKKEFTHSQLVLKEFYVGFSLLSTFHRARCCFVHMISDDEVKCRYVYDKPANNDRIIIIINKFTPFLFICITFFQLIYVVLWIIIAAVIDFFTRPDNAFFSLNPKSLQKLDKIVWLRFLYLSRYYFISFLVILW